MKFKVERNFLDQSYNVWVFYTQNKSLQVAKPIEFVFKEHADGYLLPEPTLRLSYTDAQELLPQIQAELVGLDWYNKEDRSAVAQLTKPMHSHIEDLRMIVTKLLEKKR